MAEIIPSTVMTYDEPGEIQSRQPDADGFHVIPTTGSEPVIVGVDHLGRLIDLQQAAVRGDYQLSGPLDGAVRLTAEIKAIEDQMPDCCTLH
jgi:hypothetical protein